MFITDVFYYTPRLIVVTLSGNSPRKFMPQYSKPLALQKGVDNRLQFQVLNQDQKPVDVTNKPITCRIISYDGTEVLLKKALTPLYALNGILEFFVTAAEIEGIAEQKAFYSLEIQESSNDFPIFMDQNSRARGEMNIVDSILPKFVPSYELDIPTNQSFPNANANSNVTYYSSIVETRDNPILTIQLNANEYNGNIVIQGSATQDSGYYNIQTHEYANYSGTVGHTVHGYHPYVRLEFTSDAGNIGTILVR